jgi:hypothetical protein
MVFVELDEVEMLISATVAIREHEWFITDIRRDPFDPASVMVSVRIDEGHSTVQHIPFVHFIVFCFMSTSHRSYEENNLENILNYITLKLGK